MSCDIELKVYCEPGLSIELGAVGPPGPPGPTGPVGPEGPPGTSVALTVNAGPRPISGHRAVRFVSSGVVDMVDSSSVSDRNSCVGISLGAALSGGSLQIVTSGIVSEPSWSWAPGGDVFLGDTPGQLTQTYNPSRAFSQVIGQAIDATTLWVDIRVALTL